MNLYVNFERDMAEGTAAKRLAAYRTAFGEALENNTKTAESGPKCVTWEELDRMLRELPENTVVKVGGTDGGE